MGDWDTVSTKLVLHSHGGPGDSSWCFHLDPWQICKSSLVFSGYFLIKEKLRQLRDCIVGKRPEEENVSGK